MKTLEPLDEEELRKVVSGMRPVWGPSHYESIRQRIGKQIVRKRRRHTIFASLGGVALLLSLAMATQQLAFKRNDPDPSVLAKQSQVPAMLRREAEQPAPSPPNEESRVQIVSLVPQTTVQREPEQDVLAFKLIKGAARFKVLPTHQTGAEAPPPMEVHVRDLSIRDIGTVFDVRLRPDDSVLVSVKEGLVMVTGPGISEYVRAGQSVSFYERKQQAHSQSKPATLAANPPSFVEDPISPAPEEQAVEPPEVRALLAAADQARKERRMEEALVAIRSFIERCSHTTSCSFGRFTEGKILQFMGRKVEAAEAYQLATQGPFAEEALVRAIESLEQAGLSRQAQPLKARYLATYPAGTFRGRVGLE